jgi:hypothetical protein
MSIYKQFQRCSANLICAVQISDLEYHNKVLQLKLKRANDQLKKKLAIVDLKLK